MKLSQPTYHLIKPTSPRQHRNKTTATALVFMLTILAANATPITVPNASFESPSTPVQTSTNPDIVPGWVFNVQGGSAYGTAAISSNFTSPGTSSGNNYAFINNDDPGVTDTLTSAASLGTITGLTTYTLTVAIGHRNGTGLYDNPGNVSFSLLANGVPFTTQEVTNGTVPNGTFEDFTLTYSTPSSGSIVGENLEIQMATLPEENNAYQPGFDNVRLSDTIMVVPEPKTWALLASGVIALFWRLRRDKRIFATAATVAVVLTLSAFASRAAPITVPNGSFESPSSPVSSTTDLTIVPDWVFSDPGGNTFGTNSIASNFSSPGTSSGSEYAFILNKVPDVEDTITSASLGTITPLTEYTLTVALGRLTTSVAANDDSFSLLANGVAFASQTVDTTAISKGTFADFSVTFTTPSSGSVIGEDLAIQLAGLPDQQAQYEAAFDNVRLDDTIMDVPEPPTWALLISGVLALGWLMRWIGRNQSLPATVRPSRP